jgi:hypothetical protein
VAGVLSASLFLELLDQAMQISGFTSGLRVVAQGLALVLAVSAITLGQWATFRIRRGGGRGRQGTGKRREPLAPDSHLKETP